MELFNLGKVSWEESQLIYHALAHLGRQALCLVSPCSPYVCIGYHQDVEQEVDLEFCNNKKIPVFRRQVGGGAVYLDGNQLFFQLIIRRDNPIAPKRIDAFYKKFLRPVIEVHRRIGLDAKYKPVNDIVVENRKISGTGAAEIGDSIVFVGNLILDFDYEMMSQVLKIPDEKFRDKVKKTIEENLSTIRRELGEQRYKQWNEQSMNHMLVEEFEKLLGTLAPANKNDELIAKMKELKRWMIGDAWLFQRGKRVEDRVVKVRSGLTVVQRVHKAAGGLVRADFAVDDSKLRYVSISGDFFCYPENSIKKITSELEDCCIKDVSNKIREFYSSYKFEIPGVTVDDWLQVFGF